MAPELCACRLNSQLSTTLSTKVDVYSFGVIILKVLTGDVKLPFIITDDDNIDYVFFIMWFNGSSITKLHMRIIDPLFLRIYQSVVFNALLLCCYIVVVKVTIRLCLADMKERRDIDEIINMIKQWEDY